MRKENIIMNKLKKVVLPLLLAVAIFMSCCLPVSAIPSPQRKDIAEATIVIGTKVYNDKKQKPSVRVCYGGKVLTLNKDYTITWDSSKPGWHDAYRRHYLTVNGIGAFKGHKESEHGYYIINADQSLKVKIGCKTSYTNKYSVTKRKKIVKTLTVSGARGKVTFKSNNKKIVVTKKSNSKASVTIKKGIKKGTYKITVTAAEVPNYNKTSKTFKIVIK